MLVVVLFALAVNVVGFETLITTVFIFSLSSFFALSFDTSITLVEEKLVLAL